MSQVDRSTPDTFDDSAVLAKLLNDLDGLERLQALQMSLVRALRREVEQVRLGVVKRRRQPSPARRR